MDKRVIFAVAGAGKTTHIVDSITACKRSLIVTYTNSNYDNLIRKISKKFNGIWPENVTVMTFFQFLYRFCYKPFLSDRCKARGIIFDFNRNKTVQQKQRAYYLTDTNYFYSNRLSLFLDKAGIILDIQKRITTYFDAFIVDEIQDISGRDFDFLEKLMEMNVNMLFVGDFFQHTYDTSRDGNKNKNLFNNQDEYMKRFESKGVTVDKSTFAKSWRCSKSICDYISDNLGITIESHRTDDTEIKFVSDELSVMKIWNDTSIVKLHLKESSKYGFNHKNWGDTKGEDCYKDVCVVLNKNTMEKFNGGKLSELAYITKNKLYVAITRAHGNVYFISEELFKK